MAESTSSQFTPIKRSGSSKRSLGRSISTSPNLDEKPPSPHQLSIRPPEANLSRSLPSPLSRVEILRASAAANVSPHSPMASSPSSPSRLSAKYDMGDKTIFEVELAQFHILRRLCERRISGILGEERTVELIRIPNSGNKPKFYPVIPTLEPTKSKGIFGMSLYTAVKQTGIEFRLDNGNIVRIPFIVRECLSYLSSDAVLKTDGIFRKPGHARRMAELQVQFDTRPMIPVDFSQYSVHDVAGLFKRYIRELPEPLFSLRLQNLFFAAQEMASLKRRLVCLQLLLIILPRNSRDLLQAILFFLKKISQNATVEDGNGNRMDSHNLAVVFAPNIAKSPSTTAPNSKGAEMSLKQAQEEGKESQALVETLIDHCEDLFSFQSKKICEYPLSRGDTIAVVSPGSTPREEKEREREKAQTPPLSNKERFLNELRDDSSENNTSKGRFGLTKTPSAPSLYSKTDDDLPPRTANTPVSARPRTQSELDTSDPLAELREKEKLTLGVVDENEMGQSPLALEEEEEQLNEEDDSSSISDDSVHDERLDSPLSTHSGRAFEGKFMSRALAERMEKDAKRRVVFVFGDITLKQALKIFKKLHKNANGDVIATLPPVDFSLNFDEMNIYELCLRLKDPESGVEVKNRRKNLKVFKQCFVGKDAIDWLSAHSIQGKALTRLQAQIVARELLETGLIMPTSDGVVDFKDDHVYYRFAPEIVPPLSP